MGEFLSGFVGVASIFGLLMYVSYPGASQRTQRAASLVLLLYFVSMPIASFIGGLSSGEFSIPSYDESEVADGGAFYDTAKDAFSEGIARLLEEKYSIKGEDVSVSVYGFSLKEMKAEKIKILLFGGAVTKDWRGIEEYINESGLGECEVRVRIG